MPQVDLESLASVRSTSSRDRKIACETLADGNFPPDSVYLPKDAELDWFDRNAFFDRKDSTSRNSSSSILNLNSGTNSTPSSQRSSVSKASIIGLPKPQKACFSDAKLRRRQKPQKARLFREPPEPDRKAAARAFEPSSPNVSCMGRVRSMKDRTRPCRNKHRGSELAAKKENAGRKRKPGFWTSVGNIFLSGCGEKPDVEIPSGDRPTREPPKLSSSAPPRSGASVSNESTASDGSAEPPGLGGMKRFASCRRSDFGVIEAVESGSQSANSQASDKDGVWERRGMGPPKGVECLNRSGTVGPASG